MDCRDVPFQFPAPIEAESQKLHPLRQMRHTGFVTVYLELHGPFDKFRDAFQRSLCCALAFAQDDQVVRVPYKAVPSFLEFLVQFIQVDVGEERREGASLHQSLSRPEDLLPGVYAGLQHAMDQRNHPAVPDAVRQLPDESAVVYRVKELCEVHVRSPHIAPVRVVQATEDRILRPSVRSESTA